MGGAGGLPGNPYGRLENIFQYNNYNSQHHTNYGYYTYQQQNLRDWRDDTRHAKRIENNRVNSKMLLQRANLLAHRLDQGQNTGNFEHLSGSLDFLREVKDKYDDQAKNSS